MVGPIRGVFLVVRNGVMFQGEHYLDERIGKPNGQLGGRHELAIRKKDGRGVYIVVKGDGLERVFEAGWDRIGCRCFSCEGKDGVRAR